MENQKINTEIPRATVNLKGVILHASNFRRGTMNDPGELKMGVAISFKDEESTLHVSEKINLTSEKSMEFNLEVEMVAEFEKVGNFVGSIEEFSNVNAAAIIYAYIRQHISSLTLQAEMKPVILPLVNFFGHFQKNKKD